VQLQVSDLGEEALVLLGAAASRLAAIAAQLPFHALRTLGS